LIPKERDYRSVELKLPTPSHCWEEDPLPSAPPLELFLEPELHERMPPVPLKIS
jgi:hypothetical protein